MSAPRVAIVGSRRASEAAKRWTFQLAKDLGRAGCIVISGGALGMDAAAHRGALAGAGCTWVVLPGPIETPHPSSHRTLFEDVLRQDGAWLSVETQVGGRWSYVKRNQIVAALADVIVIAEAEPESGTASTARAAGRLQRSLRVRPVGLEADRGRMNLQLLCSGAPAIRDAADILAQWPEQRVLTQVVDAEVLARQQGLSVAAASAQLMQWELQGDAQPLGGGRYEVGVHRL